MDFSSGRGREDESVKVEGRILMEKSVELINHNVVDVIGWDFSFVLSFASSCGQS